LCEFAAKMGFDPLVAENWEKLGHLELKSLTQGMASQYNKSTKLALVDTFPELFFSKAWLKGMSEKTAHLMMEKTLKLGVT